MEEEKEGMKEKKYILSLATVYMAYIAHGMQALIIGQNMEQFATQWGVEIAAVSGVIAWTGLGKFVSVWICGEISDKIGRKIMVIIGAIMYVACFTGLLTTSNVAVANVCAFAAGAATSFFDGSCYPAAQESYPKAPGSALILIKLFVSLSGIVYPIMVVNFAASGNWKMNIVIPLVASIILLVLAVIAPFVYDDELKAKKAAGTAGVAGKSSDVITKEIEEAKARFIVKPGVFTNFLTMFYGFICMAIMYAAQQYIKRFGLAFCGMSELKAAGLTSIYTGGSIVAVLLWATLMGKLGWRPLKVLLIDNIGTVISLALVCLVRNDAVIQIATFLVGFFAAGGALQTGLSLRQEFCPGNKGRNTGIYYTFMGAASYTIPVIASKLTGSLAEADAVMKLMMLNLGFAVIGAAMMVYFVFKYKQVFGVSAFSKKED